MNLFNYIKKVFLDKKENGYKHIYILVDVHNTILIPSYDNEECYQYYDNAKEVLQMLSSNEHIKLIMWTSSYPSKISTYLKHFDENGIHFDFVNENPIMKNTSFGCFNSKFFYDIGIDDKFGFDPNNDWGIMLELLKDIL